MLNYACMCCAWLVSIVNTRLIIVLCFIVFKTCMWKPFVSYCTAAALYGIIWKCCCPRGKSLSWKINLQVLVLEDQFTSPCPWGPIYKSLSTPQIKSHCPRSLISSQHHCSLAIKLCTVVTLTSLILTIKMMWNNTKIWQQTSVNWRTHLRWE